MTFNSTIEKQQQEIETILKERIDLSQKERNSIREVLSSIDAKIKATASQFTSNVFHIDKRPTETIEQINASISKMEFTHATTSQSKAQERELLKNLEKLQQKKKSLLQFNQIQAEVDELKSKRATVAAELKAKDEILDELHLGLRRVRAAMVLRVSIGEIVSHVYPVPDDRLPQVIGKGGNNLKQIETDYGVSIESERYGSNELNILGTNTAIQQAVLAIDTIVNTVAEEFTISEQAIVCLTFDKASLIQELQTKYNVRIEANRSKKICKIVGLVSIVENVKKEILALQASKEEISIDTAALPFIVGKGGVVIRGIGEENHVHIDINRDDNKIVVMGLREGVIKAVNSIRSIAEENKEIEESLKIEKQLMIGCIIGPGGATIRNIQTTFSVSLRTEKGTEVDILHITGNTSRVLAAKQHVLQLIFEYSKNSEIVSVPADCMPIILGKKGSRINALREEHSTINIDVEDNTIRICGGDAEARNKAKLVIEDILASNWSSSIPCETDLGILLKSAKGLEIRQQIVTTLNLNLDIDTEHAVIKLRGYKENVEKGIEVINTFLSGFHTLVIDLTDEDCASLMNGSLPGTDKTEPTTNLTSPDAHIYAPTKYVELKYGVEVHINRKECKLRLRGAQAAIYAAQANILGVLNGDVNFGSLVIPIDPLLYATLIGKAGSNLKRMEGELNVKFDILKSKSLLRIRGLPEQVGPAKTFVIDFMDSVRASTSVNIPNNFAAKDIEKIVEQFRNLYVDSKFLINTQVTPKVVSIRGSLLLIEEAKILMEEYFSNSASCTVKLPVQFTESSRFERAWKKIRDSCQVDVKVTKINSSPRHQVTVYGTVENVSKAKKLLNDALMTILPPSTFVAIYTTPEQLKSISLQKHIRDITEVPGLEDLVIDRPLSCIRLMSSNPESVNNAANIIQQKILNWKKGRVSVGPVDGAYVWPLLVGRTIDSIQTLEKTLDVTSVSFNRATLMIDLECDDELKIKNAISILNEKLDKIRSEHFETELEDNIIRAIIGKAGANIVKFRSELQANIDVDNNTCTLKITGTADQVTEAKEKLLKFIEEERQRNYSRVIYVPARLVPSLIGVKGGNIREIQQSTDAKIDLDKESERGTIRGSIAAVNAAIKAIQEFFDSEGVSVNIEDIPVSSNNEAEPDSETKAEEAEPELSPLEAAKLRIPPGSQLKPGAPVAKMSKSAAKRMRKKEKQAAGAVTTNTATGPQQIEEESDDEEEISENVNKTTEAVNSLQMFSEVTSVPPANTSPVKESIVAPIISLSSHIPLSSTTGFSSAPSASHSSLSAPSFIDQPQSSNNAIGISKDHSNNPLSPTDSLLNILLGRTATTNTEAALFNALNVSSTTSSTQSIDTSSLSQPANTSAATAQRPAAQTASMAQPATQSKFVPPPGVSQTKPQQYYTQTLQASQPSYSLSNQQSSNYSSYMPVHIQQQAHQQFFNPLAASYSPAPPGLLNGYPNHTGAEAFPGYFGDFGPSAAAPEFNFQLPMNDGRGGAGIKPHEYLTYDGRQVGNVFAPPGLSVQQSSQHLPPGQPYQSMSYLQQGQPGQLGYYQAPNGGRPSYTAQMHQQPYPQSAQPSEFSTLQQPPQQYVQKASSASSNTNNDERNGSNGGYYRGGAAQQKSGYPSHEMRL